MKNVVDEMERKVTECFLDFGESFVYVNPLFHNLPFSYYSLLYLSSFYLSYFFKIQKS